MDCHASHYFAAVLSDEGRRPWSRVQPDKAVWNLRCVRRIAELPEHPFYLGTQYHPEFKSRPNRPHPLFTAFIEAAVAFARSNGRAVEAAPRLQEMTT